MPVDLVADLGVIFLVAIVAVAVLGRIGLPPVVGFLVAGVFLGPETFGLVNDIHRVEVLAELGVALLLFTIGLEFSLARLARIWRYVVLGGGLQVLLTVVAAVAVSAALGVETQRGVFWGFLAALSSTAIILRSLADRQETAAPHGRFIVGVLIFQDLCVVPMMLAVPMLAGEGGGLADIGWTLGKALLIVGVVLLLARGVVPFVLHRIAATRSRELFLLTVLFIALGVAGVTAEMGLSLALGAFLGGVAVADTEFVHQAWADVSPIRDTLASLFFVSIGMLLDLGVIFDAPGVIAGLVGGLLVGKLLLVTLAALLMRFPARVAVLAGLGLAQVGEFSFVLLRSGQEYGLMQSPLAERFLASAVITMIAAPLLLAYSPRLAAGAALLRPLERLLAIRPLAEAEPEHVPLRDHVIVAGLGLGGQLLVQALRTAGFPYVAVDLNPETIITARKNGMNIRFGDISSQEVLEHVAEAGSARMLVLLLSDAAATRRAAAKARSLYPDLRVLVRAHRSERDEGELHALGVEVVSEDYETAIEVSERVLRGTGLSGEVLARALGAVRKARNPDGARVVSAEGAIGSLAIDGVRLDPGCRLDGVPIAETGLRKVTGATIVAVVRGEELFTNPPPDLRLAGGDTVFVLGTEDQVQAGRGWILACGPTRAT